MSIHVKQVEDKKQWMKFIDFLQPKTFLQTWEWGVFNKQQGEKAFYLGIFDNEELIGVALTLKVSARRGSFLFCPHGPLFTKKTPEVFSIFVEYIKDLARKEKVGFIRISPLELDSVEARTKYTEAGFRNAPIHMHPELAWMIDVTKNDETLLSEMRKNTRTAIRKAEKEGVSIQQSTSTKDINRFMAVYTDTAQRQQFVAFSRQYVERELEAFAGQGKAQMFFATHDGADIAVAFVVYSNGSGFYHHGATNSEYRKLPGSQLIQWEAIKEARKRGCNLYNFWGISPEDQPQHPWAGLSKFKQGFGGYAEKYIPAQDLIIKPTYWITYCIEVLRKRKRGL